MERFTNREGANQNLVDFQTEYKWWNAKNPIFKKNAILLVRDPYPGPASFEFSFALRTLFLPENTFFCQNPNFFSACGAKMKDLAKIVCNKGAAKPGIRPHWFERSNQ